MKLPHRRQFLHLAAGCAVLPAAARIARAQTYPLRPVRIIVGFAPAGATDIMARLIGQWLSERLSQQFIVENRPGAASNIATDAPIALRRSLPLGNPVGWRLVFRAVHRRHDQARRKAAAAEPPLPGRQSKADCVRSTHTGLDDRLRPREH